MIKVRIDAPRKNDMSTVREEIIGLTYPAIAEILAFVSENEADCAVTMGVCKIISTGRIIPVAAHRLTVIP